jgi:hypothetical protein
MHDFHDQRSLATLAVPPVALAPNAEYERLHEFTVRWAQPPQNSQFGTMPDPREAGNVQGPAIDFGG